MSVPSSLDTLLADLDQDQLRTLILKLVEHDTALAGVIESLILKAPAETTSATKTRKATQLAPQIAPNAIRHQVRSILHSLDRMRASEAYWYMGTVVNEVRKLLQDRIWPLIEADEGRLALPLLEALTETYIHEWEILDDSDGEASGFFYDLGEAWTEAILSADLSRQEGKTWARKLQKWQQAVDDYGVRPVFAPAQDAARQGSDYPPLLRVFQGQMTEQGAWEGERPDSADELTIARLHVLERRQRWQDYLFLAEAEGQQEAYVTMLVRVGRGPEAVAYGLRSLATAGEALALAQALYTHGEQQDALRIAEHGLTLEEAKFALAQWLRDKAAATGNKLQALAAARIAFQEQVNLPNYLRVVELAGDQWSEVRAELLEYTRHARGLSDGRIDVFLYEHLIDDAIAVVDTGAYYTEVAKVVDAALTSRPEWVIQACRQQAEEIMNRGKADLYHAAANWLAKARTAYQNAGREAEWRDYLAELLAQHIRKYKLVPLLKALQ
jgi:uncharacterized Zn finger protein